MYEFMVVETSKEEKTLSVLIPSNGILSQYQIISHETLSGLIGEPVWSPIKRDGVTIGEEIELGIGDYKFINTSNDNENEPSYFQVNGKYNDFMTTSMRNVKGEVVIKTPSDLSPSYFESLEYYLRSSGAEYTVRHLFDILAIKVLSTINLVYQAKNSVAYNTIAIYCEMEIVDSQISKKRIEGKVSSESPTTKLDEIVQSLKNDTEFWEKIHETANEFFRHFDNDEIQLSLKDVGRVSFKVLGDEKDAKVWVVIGVINPLAD